MIGACYRGRLARWLVVALVVLGIAWAPAARADKSASLAPYERGKASYRAEKFADAIAEFERAYQLYPAPEYLFDIAQAYRRMGDCRAIDYYRRYLTAEPGSPHHALVDEHLAALRPGCAAEPEPATRAASDGGQRVAALPEAALAERERPRRRRSLALFASTGLAHYRIGEVVTPTVATARLGGGYRWQTRAIELRAGVAVAVEAMRFDAEPNGTAWFSRALAVIGVGRRLGERVRLHAEVGGGVLVLAGLDAGNPFTSAGAAHGPVVVPALELCAGLELRLGRGVELSVTPIVVSRAASDDALSADIEAIDSIAAVIGVSVRAW